MSDREAARDLCRFVDASPTPFHAAREVERRLVAAGFSALDEREAWSFEPGDKRYTIRGGATVIAFVVGTMRRRGQAFADGAHTDSPNLRAKPLPDVQNLLPRVASTVRRRQIYASWLDRDLSPGPRHVRRGLSWSSRSSRSGASVARCRISRYEPCVNRGLL